MVPFETLVLRAQSGILTLEQRQDAFAELVKRFQNLMIQNAKQSLNDSHIVPDIVQETFLSAWLHLDSLQHPRAFPSWLKRILNTQCNRVTRRTHFDSISIEDLELAGHHKERPDSQFESRDLRNQVKDAIDHLPEHERIVVDLFYIKGYSQREISQITSLPIKTIKSRLYSARQRLLDWLQPVIDENIEKKTTAQARVLSTALRPEQATNMLVGALETTRLKTLLPIELTVQCQIPELVYVSVPEISGTIAPTPLSTY